MTASPELTLEPCPFCGATMKRADWHTSLWIGHTENCYLKGVLTFDEHVAKWNHRSSPSSALTEITEAADKLVAHLLRIRLTQSQEWIRCDCCGMWWGKSEAAKHAPHCQVDAYLKVRQPTLPEPPK